MKSIGHHQHDVITVAQCGDCTWRAERVVLGEGHSCFQVAAVVEGVGVEYDESYAPFEEVVVDELASISCTFFDMHAGEALSPSTHLDMCPSLLALVLELVHQ